MKQLPDTITSFIEIAMNRYLALDPESRARISELDGSVLEIIIGELDVSFYLSASGEHVEVLPDYEEAAQSTMRTSLLSLIRMGLSNDSGESAIGSDIDMAGDMETGRRFHALLKKVDIDWEEVLSRYTGDIVAHQIGNALRGFAQWGRETSDTFRQDLSEYLQEESRQLPSRNEINDFLEKVDDLRMAVDRAEARIRQLQNQRDDDQSNSGGQPTQ
ncbi:MAG: SCP2 sterol-binding domain-containing protein [Gammaproteobacteria bacterium]